MRLLRSRLSVVAALTLMVSGGLGVGCAQEDDGTVQEPLVLLSKPDQLMRASMALRGVRPSVADMHRVAADDSALVQIVDGYLADPAFGEVIRDMHNEALLVRNDYAFYPAGFVAMDELAGMDAYYLNRSLQDASLRLIEYVVMNDRPYTEVVTADYLLANEAVAGVWGALPYDTQGPEWQVTQWSDGRPAAGVLSDPYVFSRHNSTLSNANRGRANAISKALLCYDFLSRDIVVDSNINLADPDAVANAVVDNDACAACHQSLDPLASFFQDYFPLYVPEQLEGYPFDEFYSPDIFTFLGVEHRERGYFGQPGNDIRDLGRLMSEDPRFSLCAAQRFYAYFHQIDVDDVPLERASYLQGVFIDSGYNAKVLAREIILAEDFSVSHSAEADMADERAWVLKLRPEQIDSMIFDLTGFRWYTDLTSFELGRVPLLDDSFVGFSVLGGGLDSMYVTRPSHTFNATSSLLLEGIAGEAAAWVVERDFAEPDPAARRLLRMVEPALIDEPAVRAQLAWLHTRILGELVAPESQSVSESYGLFAAALAHTGDSQRAWQTVIAAMLQDVRVASY